MHFSFWFDILNFDFEFQILQYSVNAASFQSLRRPTAHKPWYIFSPDFVEMATFLHSLCTMRAWNYLFWINAECVCRRLFHYSLSFSPVLVEVVVVIMNIFVLKSFFRGLYPRCFPVCRDKTDFLRICVMKNICSKRSKLNFYLVWCVEYSSSAQTAHITLDVKSPISSPCCIIYYYIFFWNLRYLIKVLKCFLDCI